MDERMLRRHIHEARKTVKGEHQLPEYVARLSLAECTEVLEASPIPLSLLAARHPECRVGEDEERSFAEVIRAWTLHVLSGVEGG